jgi:hypothetical protein
MIFKKCLSFCFIYLVTLSVVKAQNVMYSPYQKFDFRTGDFSVVGKVGNKIFTYRGATDGFYLDAYNDSMVKVATVVLDFFPEKIYQTQFITYTDKIIVLYQAIELNKVVQFAAWLDENGRLKKGPLKLDEAKTGILGPNKNYFSSAVALDKKNFVVFSSQIKNFQLDINAKWLDDSLNIYNRSTASFKAENDLTLGDAMLGADGLLYLPVTTPFGSKNYTDQIWLLKLKGGNNHFEAKELPLNGKYAASVFMKMDFFNNKIYAASFFTTKKNGSNEGVFYASYSGGDSSFKVSKFLNFDAQFTNANNNDSKRKRRLYDDFQIKQIIVKNDGGFVLVSESYFVYTNYSYAPGFGYYSSYYSPYRAANVKEYHYNDIMVLSYNGDGAKEWSSIVPKTQYSQEDGGLFSSYALLNSGGTLAFLFNDFNTAHSRIQLATVNPDGDQHINSFTAEGNEYPDWLPRTAKQIDSRTLIVPCLHKRQICFAKVVF